MQKAAASPWQRPELEVDYCVWFCPAQLWNWYSLLFISNKILLYTVKVDLRVLTFLLHRYKPYIWPRKWWSHKKWLKRCFFYMWRRVLTFSTWCRGLVCVCVKHAFKSCWSHPRLPSCTFSTSEEINHFSSVFLLIVFTCVRVTLVILSVCCSGSLIFI